MHVEAYSMTGAFATNGWNLLVANLHHRTNLAYGSVADTTMQQLTLAYVLLFLFTTFSCYITFFFVLRFFCFVFFFFL